MSLWHCHQRVSVYTIIGDSVIWILHQEKHSRKNQTKTKQKPFKRWPAVHLTITDSLQPSATHQQEAHFKMDWGKELNWNNGVVSNFKFLLVLIVTEMQHLKAEIDWQVYSTLSQLCMQSKIGVRTHDLPLFWCWFLVSQGIKIQQALSCKVLPEISSCAFPSWLLDVLPVHSYIPKLAKNCQYIQANSWGDEMAIYWKRKWERSQIQTLQFCIQNPFSWCYCCWCANHLPRKT